MRKSGDRLRITVQLIDAATQAPTWANTYERTLSDVFVVQKDIARRVATGLKVKVLAGEEARLGARSAVRPDSYLAYLKGRTLLHNDTRDTLEAAKRQFELAISLDLRNAAAHSGLADTTRMLGWWFPETPRSQWNEIAREQALKAIDIDPNLAEAHASLALAFWDDFDYASAEKEFKRAVSLNPSYSLGHHWYAALLEEQGRAEEALAELLLAEQADPLWTVNLAILAQLLIWLGRLEEALSRIDKIGQLDPNSPDRSALMARYHLARADLPHYRQERERYESSFADPRRRPLIRALTLAASGEKRGAKVLVEQEAAQSDVGLMAFDLCLVSAELGELDDCFRYMEKARENHALPFQLLRLDPRLDLVRKDPRFEGIMRRMHLA